MQLRVVRILDQNGCIAIRELNLRSSRLYMDFRSLTTTNVSAPSKWLLRIVGFGKRRKCRRNISLEECRDVNW